MSSSDELRLFKPDDVLAESAIRDEAKAAAEPVGAARREDLDSARMWQSREDGLLVRGVKPHSATKSRMVSRSIATVSKAMARQWFARQYGLQYVELYSGPGRLLDESTGDELLGSPLEALEVAEGFTDYVFSDYSPDCARALKARVGTRTHVTALCGDANDDAHLLQIEKALNPRALVLFYLDPARPQDLRWRTVERIASRFKYLDLIINLPVNSLMRAILGAYSQGHAGPGAAGAFLHHAQPYELIERNADGTVNTHRTIATIRHHYDDALESLGFLAPARRTVHFPANNPYYDVLLVSRHPFAVELWNRSNPEEQDPQLLLGEL